MDLINISGPNAIMLPQGGGGGGSSNVESVSPVTLSSDWSRVARLLLLASLAVIGSIGNVFMISAIMIEDHLKKRGNAFIVNIALADLLITGLVIPASAVVILAGIEASIAICRFQWFLAVLCFMVTVLTLAAIAAENYSRLCSTRQHPLKPFAITTLILIYWAACSIASGLQFAFDISFDYCTRKTSGLIPYQITVGIVFVFMPVLLTFFCYVRILVHVRAARSRPSFKPSVTFGWDYALAKTNMYSFIMFVMFWLPFGVVLAIGTAHNIPNGLFYNLAWFAISKSCVNNILYCITNRPQCRFHEDSEEMAELGPQATYEFTLSLGTICTQVHSVVLALVLAVALENVWQESVALGPEMFTNYDEDELTFTLTDD